MPSVSLSLSQTVPYVYKKGPRGIDGRYRQKKNVTKMVIVAKGISPERTAKRIIKSFKETGSMTLKKDSGRQCLTSDR
ncbi:Hypothetical predicted protein [Octopus vulgaris]|uniref:Uncharacterized protein n=1 Tax=Octopus vulgaris TaxID=6645 RepID=A0AA36ANG6_OCTVU|nr:Hypothetical predicted protein [Octopus vulgaris]